MATALQKAAHENQRSRGRIARLVQALSAIRRKRKALLGASIGNIAPTATRAAMIVKSYNSGLPAAGDD